MLEIGQPIATLLQGLMVAGASLASGYWAGKRHERNKEGSGEQALPAQTGDPKCILRLQYVHVVEWRPETEDADDVREILVTRLPPEKQKVRVFDEFSVTSLTVFDRVRTKDFLIRHVTTGVADMLCLHPWHDKLKPTYKETIGEVQHMYADDSSVYCVNWHGYNGFQKGNTDFAILAHEDTAQGRLVVDLTSAPEVLRRMAGRTPKAFRTSNRVEDKPIGLHEVRNGVYTADAEHLSALEGIKIVFELDWS